MFSSFLPFRSRCRRAASGPARDDSDEAMTELSYAFRPGLFAPEKVYSLEPDGLEWRGSLGAGRVAYADIEAIHTGQVRFLGSSTAYWSCVLSPRSGGRIALSAAHCAGFRRFEDRSAAYFPFVAELQRRIIAANPKVAALSRRDWLDRLDTMVGLLGVGVVRLLRRVDFDRSARIAGWVARKIGPWLRGHRVARAQLALAFPEKSAAEIERILAGMWDNLGRIIVEYAHLDRLWDYDLARRRSGRITMEATVADRLQRIGAERRPALMFSAHLANWEVLALAAPRPVELVFRAPRIGPMATELDKMRANFMATMIPAGPRAPLMIRDGLRRKSIVGMLVDQHYAAGIDVTFFGRTCKVNPLLARFARMFECPIYSARIIRLPSGGFRFEMSDPLELPRDTGGRVDVAATMQLVTSIIEDWVREYPEQWMWLHRRWR
jgi:KDO2-lipid IV(A) lauroyltransferase